ELDDDDGGVPHQPGHQPQPVRLRLGGGRHPVRDLARPGRPLPVLHPAPGQPRRPPAAKGHAMRAPLSTPAPGRPTGTLEPSPRRRRSNAFSGGNPLVYGVALVVVVATLGPVVYAVLGGFRSNAQLAADPVSLPDPWITSNFVNVLTSGAFWRYALNSTLIA